MNPTRRLRDLAPDELDSVEETLYQKWGINVQVRDSDGYIRIADLSFKDAKIPINSCQPKA
jgi:hypothetical protein